MPTTQHEDLAGRLWNLCHVLRDDGIVYHKYLSELTYLLFLKNAKQLGVEGDIPIGCRWDDLLDARGPGVLGFYRKLLTRLGEDVEDENIRNIFSFPTTVFSHDENLEKVVNGVEVINWHDYDHDALGLVYETLLERNATEARSGSGQYFTPRPLVNAMVKVMKPKATETILDPAAGTGGFLIAAHRISTKHKSKDRRLYYGVEIERDTFRLCLMNLYLHRMNGRVIHGDALTNDSQAIPKVSLVLANPPFGVSAGGARKRREDLTYQTANKQLAFLQYIGIAMEEGGRAAVVVPDNVLYEPGAGYLVRKSLVDDFDLHTVLRLPKGIFYAPGVQTNVLFFNRPTATQISSENIWFYDMRSGMPNFSKRNVLKNSDFTHFIEMYGKDPRGHGPRVPGARFLPVSKEKIRAADFELDIRGEEDSSEHDIMDMDDLVSQMEDALTDAREAWIEIANIITTPNEVPRSRSVE